MSTIAAADAQIRMVPADLSGMMRNLATLNGADGASSLPLWSLDGSFISFSSNRAGGVGDWDVYVGPIDPMTGADSAARNVTQANTTGFEHSAQWSP
jgi:Tol biopolymer transport system component